VRGPDTWSLALREKSSVRAETENLILGPKGGNDGENYVGRNFIIFRDN
jgi:hypothetical protein